MSTSGGDGAAAGRALDRLSSPLESLRAHYEILVVGSGYGGSIAASRLARAGRDVALFERGRELHPGEYPRTAGRAAPHIQVTTAEGGDWDRRGLYWFHADGDMNVLSGCGLGGTSLINASVALEPDPRVFEDERWPRAVREDGPGLRRAYSRAAAVLAPEAYPASMPPLPKVAALARDAGSSPFSLTPITVSFRTGANPVGIHQDACNGCGDCVTGCNYGAKSTLLMNYLPDAVDHGARVFTEVEVQWLERSRDRWVVMAQPLGVGRDRFRAPPVPVTAEVVVLAAGTLGSTAVLLRSRRRGLDLSGQLGSHFTGNGDVLGFAFAPGRDVRGVGSGPRRPDPGHPPGPCITAVIDERPGRPVSDGVIVEDAVIPGALAPMVPFQLAPQLVPDWLRGRLAGGGPLSFLASLLTRGRRGLLEHIQTFLVMGHDDDEGRIVLAGDEVRVEWPDCGSSSFYARANSRLQRLTAAAGTRYLHSPIWSRLLHHRLITVHPLGGCAMGDSPAEGVVDHRGRVYDGGSDGAVHEGLFVWDGSIIPRPLGVNPLLTISALAERGVALLAEERGWKIDYSLPSSGVATARHDAPGAPATGAGLEFTERMAGWWSPDCRGPGADRDEFLDAARAGQARGGSLAFELTISTDDARSVTTALDTPMSAVGTVEAPALSDDSLTVDGGVFRLLAADDPTDPSVRHMRYELPLVTTEGRRYHLSGYKIVQPGDVSDLWPDTTTLYVTVRHDGPEGDVAGLGVLRIEPGDFARQLLTMKITGPVGEADRLVLLERFGRAFGGALFRDYGTLLHRSVPIVRGAPARHRRPLDVPPARVHPYKTDDGAQLRLTRYRGGHRGPVVLVHGMGANPLTYSLDTIRPNLLEYLVGHGFDVWLQEWRGSTLLPAAHRNFTADQVARFDHPAAEQVVRAVTGRTDVHWVTHCVGSITWMMATLGGTVRPASLLCSQVGAHPIGPRMTRLKVRLHAADALRAAGIRFLTTDSYDDEARSARAFDQALRLYPVPRVERCKEAVCRRLAFIYGIAVHHPAVDDTTHATLHELFGVTNLTMMDHLAHCAGAGRIIAADGSDAYLPHLHRLRLPVTFLHGRHNLVWVPESTARTHAVLEESLGPGFSQRFVFDGHGHQDTLMGADSAGTVFPTVLAHLARSGA